MQGFIKLHRQITEWEWYKNIPVKVLFLHCLLRANHADKKWQGILIKKGSFVTSYENLCLETGLSYKQIRTALDKLKRTGEVAHQTTSQYSIIAVKNWDKFQIEGSQMGSQRAGEGQAEGRQRATNKNDKNEKNDKKYIIPTKNEILDYVHSLCKKIDVDNFIAYYEASNWCDNAGLPINWKQKAITWANKYKEPEEEDIIDRNTRIIKELEAKAIAEGKRIC